MTGPFELLEVQSFQHGLKYDPDDALLYWNLAVTYHSIKKPEEAIQSAKQALALGLNTSLHRHAVNFLKKLGDKDNDAV